MLHQPAPVTRGATRARWWLWSATILIVVALSSWVVLDRRHNGDVKHSVEVPIGTAGTVGADHNGTKPSGLSAPDAGVQPPAARSTKQYPSRSAVAGRSHSAAARATTLTMTEAGAFPAIATGSSHVVALSGTGVVWTWGSNGSGQLGDGTQVSRATPQAVAISGVIAIAAGDANSYAIKSDGTVWAWGYNGSGQIGDGTTTFRPSPVAVSGLSSIIAIAAGANHAMALKSDGTLWTWGSNSSGQIGDNTTTTRATPVQVTSLGTSVQTIAAASDHSHASKTDGTVWSWGSNQYSELGDGTTTTPRKVPVQTGTLSTMTGVAAGSYSGFAWDSSGALSAWGYNGYYALADGTATNRSSPISVSSISAVVSLDGATHTVAAKADGTVWAWGYNAQGQVGDGTTTTRTSPVQLATLDGVTMVGAGAYFSVALSSDGRIWTWGDNYYGSLGDGTQTQRNAPVQISDAGFAWRVATPTFSPEGGSFSANVTVTVATATAGATIHYTTNGVDPVDTDPTVGSGGTVSISQTTTLKARAWMAGMATSSVHGATYTLTAGTPSFSPGTGTYATAQTVTLSTSTAGATIRYTTDGTTPTAASPVYTAALTISTGTTVKAIALKTNWTTSAVASATYMFNYGTLAAPVLTPTPGQIGYGSQVSMLAAAFATIRYTTDGTAPTAASAVYTTPITVTGTITILTKAFHPDWTTSAQAGGAYTVKVSSPAFSPGAGTYAAGQLVTITDATPGAVVHYTTNGATPTATDLVIPSGGTVVAGFYTLKAQAFLTGWTSSDVASAAYALTSGFTNWAVAGGSSHTVALRNDGTVWTWGAASGGAVGSSAARPVPTMVNGLTGVVAISAGVQHTLALRSDGTVWAWGDNTFGELGDTTTTSRPAFAPVGNLSSVNAIAAGSYFSVALKSDGTVWAWGSNSDGQLGDGTRTQRNVATQVPALSGVAAIAAGDLFTVVRKTDGTVWAWGNNQLSQLGDTTQGFRTTPGQVPGVAASAGPWAGYAHTLVSTADGSVYAWGWNNLGQSGGTAAAATPRLVSGIANLTAADGSTFTIARASDGTVWTFGADGSGQIGDGTVANAVVVPTQVTALTDVAAVAAGLNHAVAVTADGSVWAWGSNVNGELGDGTLNDRHVPTQISEPGFNWKTSTPRLSPYTGSYSAETAITVSAMSPAADIHYTTNGVDPTQSDATVASGATVTIDQSVTLKARAWAAGMPVSNVAGATYTMNLPAPTLAPATGTYLATQSVTMSSSVAGATIRYTTDGTDPTAASPAYASAASVDATTIIKAKSFRTGWTDSGTTTTTYTLKAVPPTFSPTGGSFGAAQAVTITTTTPSATIRYTMNGSEPTAASTGYATPITVASTTTVKAIASRAGWLDSDSSAASFWITQGTAAAPTFIPSGGTFASAVDVSIASATAGASIRYTLDGSDPTSRSALYLGPMTIALTTTIKARAFNAGYVGSAVGTAAFGLDPAGAVDTPALTPGGGWSTTQRSVTVTAQAAGAVIHYTTTGVDPVESDPVIASGAVVIVDRSMVVKAKAWHASLAPSGIRRADYVVPGAVAVGGASSYALKADGTVWAWGANAAGQLGDGTTTSRPTPVQVSGLTDVVGIAAGSAHGIAVKSDGTVWAWGANGSGQLGDGTGATRFVPTIIAGFTGVVAVAAGELHSLALKADGSVWAWGENVSGQLGDGTTTARFAPVMVPALTGVSRIAAGYRISFAIEDDGTGSGPLWAWGANGTGQLGDGSTLARSSPVQVNGVTDAIAISAGLDFALAIRRDVTVWAWGSNVSGQLGDGTNGTRLSPVALVFASGVSAVTAGRYHSAAATNDGRVWTWGSDAWSTLGDGAADRNYPQAISGVSGTLAIVSSANALHTVALQWDGTLTAWGNNGSGQLGDGTTTVRPTPVGVSGLTLATNTWLLGDPDEDGLITIREYLIGTDPLNADTNRDDLRDGTADAAGISPTNPDTDGDGAANWVEIAQGTDPFNPDTDGDGVPDGVDCFPLDPARSACLVSNPLDHTSPVITLIEPIGARRIP